MSESLGHFADRTSELDGLRQANFNLAAKVRELKAKQAALVEAVYAGAKDATLALGKIAPVPRPKVKDRSLDAEAAVWHLTDWQGAKVSPTYNSGVMRVRVERFLDKAERLTQIARADHPVNRCVIAFGGDMVEGLFNFPTQAFEIDQTIFGQFVTVANLEVDVVRRALSIYEQVIVVAEPGNHGRIGNKSAVVPKSDNLDRMTYELARQQLRQEDPARLFWDPRHGEEDIQRIEVGNYRALLIHGDEIGRGGFASPMTMVRHADRWASGAYAWDFRDVYVGHYHNHAEWSMANGAGALYQTGSIESDNHYARDTMAASATPSQRLHFIDQDKGRVTSQFKVYVDG